METVQAKEKMQGRASEAGSSGEAPGACQDDGRALEEGHASNRAAGASQTKRLSLSALVMKAQKLTSALVKASSQAVVVPRVFWWAFLSVYLLTFAYTDRLALAARTISAWHT